MLKRWCAETDAVGLIEVYGLTAAFVAADAACKAAEVTIQSFDKNKPANAEKLDVPLNIMIKIRGGTAEVTEAVNAAVKAANEVSGVVASHIIANPVRDTENMLKINALGK